jgi:hypothetical protein
MMDKAREGMDMTSMDVQEYKRPLCESDLARYKMLCDRLQVVKPELPYSFVTELQQEIAKQREKFNSNWIPTLLNAIDLVIDPNATVTTSCSPNNETVLQRKSKSLQLLNSQIREILDRNAYYSLEEIVQQANFELNKKLLDPLTLVNSYQTKPQNQDTEMSSELLSFAKQIWKTSSSSLETNGNNQGKEKNSIHSTTAITTGQKMIDRTTLELLIDRVAATVFSRGSEYEEGIRLRYKDDPVFSFIHPTKLNNGYYRWKLEQLRDPEKCRKETPIPPSIIGKIFHFILDCSIFENEFLFVLMNMFL